MVESRQFQCRTGEVRNSRDSTSTVTTLSTAATNTTTTTTPVERTIVLEYY